MKMSPLNLIKTLLCFATQWRHPVWLLQIEINPYSL